MLGRQGQCLKNRHIVTAVSTAAHLLTRTSCCSFPAPDAKDAEHAAEALPISHWQAVGSMLLATSEAEGAALWQRRDRLVAAGVEGAEVLTAAQVHQLEPSLSTGAVHSGLLVPSDSQVNGKATAAALLRACEAHGPRFTALFHEAAAELVTGPTGRVEGVATAARRCAELGFRGGCMQW